MGLMRWLLVLGGTPVNPHSAKYRTARAAEKQLRLQRQALKRGTHATGRSADPAPTNAVQVRAVSAASARDSRADVAGELQRLAMLHAHGALTDAEFAAAKEKVITGR